MSPRSAMAGARAALARLLGRLPEPARRPAELAALAVGVAALAATVTWPSCRFLEHQRRAWIQTRGQIAAAQALEAQQMLPTAREALQRRYDELLARLNGHSVARILELLSERGRADALEIVVQQSKDEDPGTDAAPWPGEPTVSDVPLTLKLTGRYRSIGAFLGWLAEAPFVCAVESVRVEKLEDGAPGLHALVHLHVFLSQRPAPSP